MANKTEITASPGGREVLITQVLDAPLEKVWRAYTEPELFIQWAGPRRLKGRVDTWEMKPGGKYHYTHIDTDGREYLFQGFHHLIDKPKRLVRTFEYLGVPGHVALEAVTFEDLGGKTKVSAVSVFETQEDRDGMIQSGMKGGVVEGTERLDELLTKL